MRFWLASRLERLLHRLWGWSHTWWVHEWRRHVQLPQRELKLRHIYPKQEPR